MKRFVTALTVLALGAAEGWAQQAPLDVRITNVRGDQFTFYWLTAAPAPGWIQYSTAPSGPWIDQDDDRGPDYVGTTHHCTIQYLNSLVTYYVRIVSDGAVYLNAGVPWDVTTGPFLEVIVSADLAYGKTYLADGTTPAAGAVAFIKLQDANGVGTSGDSALVSMLVTPSGWWAYDLTSVLRADVGDSFVYTPDDGDNIVLEVSAGDGGTVTAVFTTATVSPSSPIVLSGGSSAPDTWITVAPGLDSGPYVGFAFEASEPGSTFEVALDSSPWEAIGTTSSITYSNLSHGSHTFYVRATDPEGNADPTPASLTWAVDALPPDTLLTGAPANPSSEASATFTFASTEPNSMFEAALDGGAWTPLGMASTYSYANLADGAHLFEVRATDAVGNVDLTPAAHPWVIETEVPPGVDPLTLSPATGATLTTGFPTLGWGSVTGATGYFVTVYTSTGTQVFQTTTASTSVVVPQPLPAGLYTWEVTAMDGELALGAAAGGSFTILMGIQVAELPAGVVGAPYSALVAVSGGLGPHVWSLATGLLPPGLALDPIAGVIAGVPTQAGTFPLTIQVEDASSPPLSSSMVYVLEVTGSTLPLLIVTSGELPAATVGAPYAVLIEALGGFLPYVWSAAGALPAGLSLGSETGLLSGVPAQAGAYSFTIQVLDASSPAQAATLATTLEVQVGSQLTIVAPSEPVDGVYVLSSGVVGSSYGTTFSTLGATGSVTWTVPTGPLPAGVALGPGTGEISGVPSEPGTFLFTVQATDEAGATASIVASLTIWPGGAEQPAIVLPVGEPPGAVLGEFYTFTFSATGGTTPYLWSIVSGALPEGLTLAPATGEISGIPEQMGSFPIKIQVEDASGLWATANAMISVAPGSGGTDGPPGVDPLPEEPPPSDEPPPDEPPAPEGSLPLVRGDDTKTPGRSFCAAGVGAASTASAFGVLGGLLLAAFLWGMRHAAARA